MSDVLITYAVFLALLTLILTVWHRIRVRWRNADALDAANRREDEI